MSERPEAQGEKSQLISVESFAQAHGLGQKETAYAMAAQGIELFVDPLAIEEQVKVIVKDSSKIAHAINFYEAKLIYDRDRRSKKRKEDPKTVRAQGKQHQAAYRARKKQASQSLDPSKNSGQP